MKKTLTVLQAGRGLAALAVVLYHTGLEMGSDPRFWHHVRYSELFGPGELGVEFFFLLSGIVILLAHWRDIGNPTSFRHYAWKRFRRIYPIYWVVLTVLVAALYTVPGFQPGVDRHTMNVVSSYLLVHLYGLETVLRVAWTLFHEILFYLFFSLTLLSRRAGLAAMGLWLTGSLFAIFGAIQNPALLWFFSPLHLLFGMGMFLAWLLKTQKTLHWRPLLVTGFFLVLGVLVWSWRVHHRTDIISVSIGLALSLLLLGLIELERREKLQVSPMLLLMGDASYSIYLVHYWLLSLLFRLIYGIAIKHEAVPLWVWFTLASSITVSAGLLVHLYVERPLLRMLPTHIPGGNRKPNHSETV